MRPATVLRTALVIATLLTAVSLWIRIAALDQHDTPGFRDVRNPSGLAVAYRLFSVDDEANIPTWFSVILLAAIAATSLGIGVLQRSRRAPLHRYWLGLAAVFGYLSLDELSVVHEELIWQIGDLADSGGVFTHAWVVVGGPLVVVFALVYLRFLWRLPRHIAQLLVLSGALYVGGALGLEMAGGPHVGFNTTYVLLTGGEEFLEMVGAAVCLYTVMRYAWELLHGTEGAPAHPAPTAQRDVGGRNTANGSVTSSSGETNR
ncbi:hypothetical protein [Blastococcus sp. CCUG 61487]|uniref:hypothetical protein n=1 Tax=Blastococcus sp. CCUG 61487 TaxID=1840703 RepID=UPI0010BF8BD1|nr:hypothetical protein [Blastococcus sp. CCUG 61487]